MAKREHYLLVDTETTKEGHVLDFGALVCDRKGRVYHECAIIVSNFREEMPFYLETHDLDSSWSHDAALAKRDTYARMLTDGKRMLASVSAINRWLARAAAEYSPMLTAYNLAFDTGKCRDSGIDLDMFSSSFCLWYLAAAMFADRRDYKEMILAHHYFGARTSLGNMTYKTNAEVMAHYITGEFRPEPHTAIEDARGWELPILLACVNRKGWKKKIGQPYNWEAYQLRDNFKPA